MEDRPHLIGEAEANTAPGAPGYWKSALIRLPGDGGHILAGIGLDPGQTGSNGEKGVVQMTETEACNWATSHLPIDTV